MVEGNLEMKMTKYGIKIDLPIDGHLREYYAIKPNGQSFVELHRIGKTGTLVVSKYSCRNGIWVGINSEGIFREGSKEYEACEMLSRMQ